MEILNEFDTYQAALKKVKLDEEVMPFVRGKLLTENLDIYAKIQKLLGCKEFEPCHRFLYDLDIENIDESEASKVNNLYKLGCDRGFFDENEDDESTEEQKSDAEMKDKTNECGTNEVTVATTLPATPAPIQASPTSAFTVLYSAMRDGQIKTGEAFSNAINTRSAKADVISKLERAGYSSIQILAIEAGDPDAAGCSNTYCKQPDVKEADDRELLSHALDTVGIKASTANTAGQDAVAMSVVEKDDASTDDSKTDDTDKEEDKDSEADAENKKEEKAEEPDEKLKDGSDLTDGDKANLKDSYKKAFKATMLKLKYDDKCFDDLDLQQKVDFFTELSAAWKGKADPKEFMSDKEVEALEKIVVKR